MYKLVISTVILSFMWLGCKNDKLIRRGDSIDVAYDKAMAFFEAEDYADAADAFEVVVRQGRGTEYGQEAQYYLAESYYQNGLYLLAASEYDRFVSFYPQDSRRQEAEFKAALSYFNQSPRFKLDQSTTRQAIERFQLFNNRYPDSPYVTEAADKIDQLRSKLAHKSYEAAQFYVRNEQYEAGAIYLENTIDQYPETEWAEVALLDLIETYINYADNSIRDKQAERYQLALDTYDKFLQLFPESPSRNQAELLRDEAAEKLADISPVTQNNSNGPK